MDLHLDADQKVLADGARMLFDRHAGVARARSAGEGTGRAAIARLEEAGYLDVAAGGEPSDWASGVLLIEQAVRACLRAPLAGRLLVGPYIGLADLPPTIGLAAGDGALVRFGADVDAVLLLEDDEVRLLQPDEFSAKPVASRAPVPMARVTALPGRGALVGRDDAAARMLRAWRVALAAEIGACMTAAIGVARRHVSVRTQFGRHIGSMQAVQHLLAGAHVHAAATTWLARRAAYALDDDLQCALAATYATSWHEDVFTAVHQVVGAIGFADEFDLHLWSLQLPVLAAECGGPEAHARAVSALTWPAEAAAAPESS
jgi:hypothetical protein